MDDSPPSSVDRLLLYLARHHRLKPGQTILKGERFEIAFGGAAPGLATYLLLDRGHIVQRRTMELDAGINRRTVGGYVGSRYLRHRLTLDPVEGLVAEVEDETTREVERLKLSVAWPSETSFVPVGAR